MLIGIISDIHLSNNWYYPLASDPNITYIVAGDVSEYSYVRKNWLNSTFPDGNYLFVDGNHDYYNEDFPDPEYSCWEREIDGIKFAGATLWSYLTPSDWILYRHGLIDYRYIENLTYEKYMAAHEYQKKFLLNSGADVIISHHGPTHLSVAEKYRGDPYNVCFTNNLYNEIHDLKNPPKLWIQGHTHVELDYMIGDKTRVICHPRGYKHDGRPDYKPLFLDI